MTETLDFRRVLSLVLRHKFLVAAATLIGLVGGAAWSFSHAPLLTSEAWVQIPSAHGGVQTQVVIANSEPVLERARPAIHPPLPLATLQDRVEVRPRTPAILAIDARGLTAQQAIDTANAVARSYIRYVSLPKHLPDGPVQAIPLALASSASAPRPATRLVGSGLLGGMIGFSLAVFGVLAFSRRDRRLRERDAIADSIGVPVLASVDADHPSDAAGWGRLLAAYQPSAVDAWRLRKVLQYVGLTDVTGHAPRSGGVSVMVLCTSFDRGALALGPQLAVFAASRGIPTALVIGPQQDVTAVATLRAACAAPPADLPGPLQVVVHDGADATRERDTALTVVVGVVDAESPDVPAGQPTTATVLGVSAGAATAEQLARIAASAAAVDHDLTGILVADPYAADTTTGRMPQVDRPAQRRRPTRVTGPATGTGK